MPSFCSFGVHRSRPLTDPTTAPISMKHWKWKQGVQIEPFNHGRGGGELFTFPLVFKPFSIIVTGKTEEEQVLTAMRMQRSILCCFVCLLLLLLLLLLLHRSRWVRYLVDSIRITLGLQTHSAIFAVNQTTLANNITQTVSSVQLHAWLVRVYLQNPSTGMLYSGNETRIALLYWWPYCGRGKPTCRFFAPIQDN